MSSDPRTEQEQFIEELLGELVELRAKVAELSRPPAPVIDLAARRRKR